MLTNSDSLEEEWDVEVKSSSCRNFTANCGAIFEVEGNKVLKHYSDLKHAVSEGFMCIRGDMTVELMIVSAPDNNDGRRLHLRPADVAEELAVIAQKIELERFDYRLVTRRIAETLNSAFRHAAITRRRHSTNSLYMHPDDIARDGLKDGTLVSISGLNGSIRAYVKSDATMRAGVVSMTHCWGSFDPDHDPSALSGSHASRLVSVRLEDVQPIDGMPMHSSLPVNIGPIAHNALEA